MIAEAPKAFVRENAGRRDHKEISGKVRIHARMLGMRRHPTGSPHGRHSAQRKAPRPCQEQNDERPWRGRPLREGRSAPVEYEENKIRYGHVSRKCSHSECGNVGHSSNWRIVGIVGCLARHNHHLLTRHRRLISPPRKKWCTRDVGEDATVAKLGDNDPVCEENEGLDSPEYVDFFYDDTSERALEMMNGLLVAEFFAAKPPLSCSKCLLGLARTDRFLDEFIDVQRAHARRRISVNFPKGCANLRCTSLAACVGRRKSEVC